jgi:hypothetical protein
MRGLQGKDAAERGRADHRTASLRADGKRDHVAGDGEIDFAATEIKRLELKKTGTFETAYMAHFYNSVDIKPI